MARVMDDSREWIKRRRVYRTRAGGSHNLEAKELDLGKNLMLDKTWLHELKLVDLFLPKKKKLTKLK